MSAPSAGGVDPLDGLALDPSVRAVFTEYEEHRLREALRKGHALFRVRAEYSLADFDQHLATLNERLRPFGEVTSTLPSSQPGSPENIAFDLLFATSALTSGLSQALQELGATAEQIRYSPKPPAAPPAPAR